MADNYSKLPVHLTPASSLWKQLWTPGGFAKHSRSDNSLPKQ